MATNDHRNVLGSMPAVDKLNLVAPIPSTLPPATLAPPLTLEQKAKIAFEYLAELKVEKYQLTHEQMDLAVSMPLKFLPPNDIETLKEIALHNGVPLWQALYAQFRRCNENGLAWSLVLDPGWLQIETLRLAQRQCPECDATFLPATDGQRFCTDLCGSAKDRRDYEERRTKAGPVNAVVNAPAPAIVENYGPFVSQEKEERESPGFIPVGVEGLAARLRQNA